jgi:hypothetical protein
MKFIFPACLFFLFFITACDKTARNADGVALTKEGTEEFKSFIEKFQSDTAFQMKRIYFPLAGKPIPLEGGFVLQDTFFWHRNNWKYHQPFDSIKGNVQYELRGLGFGVLGEYIISEGLYYNERRFSQDSGKWSLIYYAPMQPAELLNN